MRAKAKVLDRLAGILGTTQEQGIGAGRGLHSQLIEGQALAAGLLDAGARRGGEAESGDVELGHGEQAVVVGDGADHDDGLVAVAARVLGAGAADVDDARDGDGGPVDLRHEEPAEDYFVEVGVGAA